MIQILKNIQSFYFLLRRLYYSTLVRKRAKSCGKKLFVNHYSKINKNCFLGNNVNFNGLIILGRGKVIIGDNFHSGQRCEFITQFHKFNDATKIPYDETYVLKDIIIEDNVWLGNQVMVLGGVTIGEGAIIQAGSVVVKNIPKYAIAGGHPAVVFSERNIEQYEKLKSEQKFH